MNPTIGAAEVEAFRAGIARRMGLSFDETKSGQLAEVLRQRLEATGRSSERYLAQFEPAAPEPSREEIGALARSLTVGETYFFRNPDQFRAVSELVLPERMRLRSSFTPDGMQAVVERIADALVPGGYLFLGHAETLRGVSQRFALCHTHGTFYYQVKPNSAGLPRPVRDELPIRAPFEALPLPLVDAADGWVDAIRKASERIHALSRGPQGAQSAPPVARPSWDLALALELLQTLKLVSRIRVITHPRARLRPLEMPVADAPVRPSTVPPQACALVAIGASTGGPGAIVDILRALPTNFQLPLLLVLHIGEPFGVAFADWLDTQTNRRVAYPREGDLLSSAVGRVVMAPPGRHMLLERGRFRLSDAPERHSCRPSVDVLFESLARDQGSAVTACLLTGMGRDGAAGLLALRQAGAQTIAQDEATCVVYGMPREAVLLNAASRVLPLGEIAPALARLGMQGVGGK